jgi:hypothetical protein
MRMDIAALFYELSLRVLQSKGRVALISSIQFLVGEYGRGLRRLFLNNKIDEILDLRDVNVFEDVTTYTGVIVIEKDQGSKFSLKKIANSAVPLYKSGVKVVSIIDYKSLSDGIWVLETDKKAQLLKKLNNEDFSLKLSVVGCAHAGLVTGADEIFIHSEDELKQLGIEKECCNPLIRSFDPERWVCPSPSYYVIYPYELKGNNIVQISEWELSIKYPGTYTYLKVHKTKLKSRQDSRRTMGEKGNWFGLVRFGDLELFNNKKLVTPGETITNTFALDSQGYAYPHARICAVTAKSISLTFLLAVLNSRLMEFYLHAFCPVKRGGYRSYSATFLNDAPIRSIDFITPAAERNKQLEKIMKSYSNSFDTIIRLITPNGIRDIETSFTVSSDVIHDLLSFLSEQMIEMSKQNHTEANRFLLCLEEKLRIQPGNKSNIGIDALIGKSTIKLYLGDYQKNKDALPFDSLMDILHKNRSRIGINLSDNQFVSNLKSEYEKSLSILLPVKEKLKKTDWLIDQIVYRLYGLTEEEIKIVEGTDLPFS